MISIERKIVNRYVPWVVVYILGDRWLPDQIRRMIIVVGGSYLECNGKNAVCHGHLNIRYQNVLTKVHHAYSLKVQHEKNRGTTSLLR